MQNKLQKETLYIQTFVNENIKQCYYKRDQHNDQQNDTNRRYSTNMILEKRYTLM